ncbi:MAG: replication initiator protein A [Alphaproteobacteria bacterium]|nr:replication initiator protein A [Alphaproteobacteria bacterium]
MGDIIQFDMFTVSTLDPPLRDNRDVMEYPFLALQKRRTKPIEYRNSKVSIEVHAPEKFGVATVWDWDLIIFAASHLNEAIERGGKPSPRIQFSPHDALRQMGRTTGGLDYKKLADAIKRLSATLIITNIRFDDQPKEGAQLGFHWLSGFSIPIRYQFDNWMTLDAPDGDPDPAKPWEIELPPWLYNAVLRQRDILAVHPDYFKLTGGIERWLYRLARKSVPDHADAPLFAFRMETLFERSGLSGRLRDFRTKIEDIAARQSLPEYDVVITRDGKRNEMVTLVRNRAKPPRLPRGVPRLSVVED